MLGETELRRYKETCPAPKRATAWCSRIMSPEPGSRSNSSICLSWMVADSGCGSTGNGLVKCGGEQDAGRPAGAGVAGQALGGRRGRSRQVAWSGKAGILVWPGRGLGRYDATPHRPIKSVERYGDRHGCAQVQQHRKKTAPSWGLMCAWKQSCGNLSSGNAGKCPYE